MEKMDEAIAAFCLLRYLYRRMQNPERFSSKRRRNKCLQAIRTLKGIFSHLPVTNDKTQITNFCLANATIILCTASGSFKLRSVEMEPLQLCVIDEAAQLKECESLIPLQLSGVRHAVLIGDEHQLSAMVMSRVAEKAKFGRSLFQRLVSLGYEKQLLDTQYRMHPSISFFPNSSFYDKKLRDAENVEDLGFERRYLKGEIFGPYSFINIAESTECLQNQRSQKNFVEVAVIARIVQKLFSACGESKREVSVGIVSPYTAQVYAISEKLGRSYDSCTGFDVKVKTVDGFQGGEEDIIIISTVRANNGGSVGFLSNHQRTNVALTRAKYCLWILGHEPTLVSSGSIWKKLVADARNRNCFFNADEDESLAEAIVNAKMELGQFDEMLQPDSLLFRNAKWKVLFTESFKISFEKTEKSETRKEAVELLVQLCNGNLSRENELNFPAGSALELLQLNLVGDDQYCLFWSVDVEKKSNRYIQILKFWAFLPREEAPKLVKRMRKIFSDYSEDYISRCKFKLTERELEVPMSWEVEEDDASSRKNEVEDLMMRLASFYCDE